MARLALAPMQGLADDVMREVLTAIGGYDWCVTEFIRITDALLPNRAFHRMSPELAQGGRTEAGTPIVVQLLGSDPECLADNAARAAGLGPQAVDLNFGCPAPMVNRHGGGAILLNDPELLHRIVATVRRAMPADVPLTAKMRLGVKDTALTLDCARALAEGGAAELVVHARTKEEGYTPPAHWHWIARIAESVAVPVVANGEVWTLEDWQAIREVSGCADVMLGRGAVADPLLARRIKGESIAGAEAWALVVPAVADFWLRVQAKLNPRHRSGRLKLWLGLLRRTWPEAEALFQQVRPARDCEAVTAVLAATGVLTPAQVALWRSREAAGESAAEGAENPSE